MISQRDAIFAKKGLVSYVVLPIVLQLVQDLMELKPIVELHTI